VFEAYELVLKEKTFPCLEKQGGGTWTKSVKP
jgi:hypothetical protein